MIHIGICDDDKSMQKQIYDIVQHELFKYDDAEYTYRGDRGGQFLL